MRFRFWWLAVAMAAWTATALVACGSSRSGFQEDIAPSLGTEDDGDAGLCASKACPPFHVDCNNDPADGCEANTRSDIDNCGGCGIQCGNGGAPPPNTTPACLDGKCVYLCVSGAPQPPLFLGPMGNCSGADPTVGDPVRGCPNQLLCDPRNCGACGVVAPADSEGNRVCRFGSPGCPAGTTHCNDGTCGEQCKDLDHDGMNCGACGRTCPDPAVVSPTNVALLAAKHVTFACNGPNPNGGLPDCKPICATPRVSPQAWQFWKDCDGDLEQTVADPANPAFNGCEVDTFDNKNNCGACGKACQEACHLKPGSTPFNLELMCDCPPGQTWCGDACVDTKNDPRHCGSCAGACLGPWAGGNGSPVCVDSQCSYKCNAGFANCNKQLPDGCEVDTENFPDHCGSCGHQCEKDQRCGNGVCLLEPCTSGAVR